MSLRVMLIGSSSTSDGYINILLLFLPNKYNIDELASVKAGRTVVFILDIFSEDRRIGLFLETKRNPANNGPGGFTKSERYKVLGFNRLPSLFLRCRS